METSQVKSPQALADVRRRDRQFQVRLSTDLAAQVRSYMKENGLNENQAIKNIITNFFEKNA
jgi:hypothetical protein